MGTEKVLAAVLIGDREDDDDVVAVLLQRIVDIDAEGRLANDRDAHSADKQAEGREKEHVEGGGRPSLCVHRASKVEKSNDKERKQRKRHENAPWWTERGVRTG